MLIKDINASKPKITTTTLLYYIVVEDMDKLFSKKKLLSVYETSRKILT